MNLILACAVAAVTAILLVSFVMVAALVAFG